jgi:hypothetical protein
MILESEQMNLRVNGWVDIDVRIINYNRKRITDVIKDIPTTNVEQGSRKVAGSH